MADYNAEVGELGTLLGKTVDILGLMEQTTLDLKNLSGQLDEFLRQAPQERECRTGPGRTVLQRAARVRRAFLNAIAEVDDLWDFLADNGTDGG